MTTNESSQAGTPQSVTAPLPESWNTPEGWASWLAVLNEELSRRGLPLYGEPKPLPAAEPEPEATPCPPWCTCKDEHPDSPYHFGEYDMVTLSLIEAEVLVPPAAPGMPWAPGMRPAELLTRLERGWHGRETTIAIVHLDRYDLDLTLAEAGELAEILTALICEAGTA